jgi:hypothetical protein
VWPVPPRARCARTRDDTLAQTTWPTRPTVTNQTNPHVAEPCPPKCGAKPVVRAPGQSAPLDQIGQYPGRRTGPTALVNGWSALIVVLPHELSGSKGSAIAGLMRRARPGRRWPSCRCRAGGRPKAARRAGLEFVEKLLTSAMVALLDGAEREHAARPRPARRIAGRAGYRSWLRVDLVAVAHRRLGPSSSAATSTTARLNALTRAAPGVFSMQHGLLPEEGSPRAFSPTALRRPASPACSSS